MVTVINIGIRIDKGEKNCLLYHPLHNIGNLEYYYDENENFAINKENNTN